ncbi:MAG: amidohydrolase family protein [Saprospiraceae bacterium]
MIAIRAEDLTFNLPKTLHPNRVFKQECMRKLLFFMLCCLSSSLLAQITFPENGVADNRDGLYAFTNATIYKSFDQKLENSTLIIKDGKVIAVGQGVRIPPDAVVIDATGKTIYPAFIDLYAQYGLPAENPEPRERGGRPQFLTDKKGAFAWNEALKTEFDAVDNFEPNSKEAKEWREAGFGTVLSQKMDGISRGSATLVAVGDERAHEMILKEKAGHFLTFSKGTSTQNYPSSLMGYIALIRQTYLDGKWYAEIGKKEEINLSLEAWNQLQSLPQFFAVSNRLDLLRANEIAKEFGVKYIIKGGGDEYQRIEEIKATGAPLILPLEFPDAYDVENPFDAEIINYNDLKHWEMAPANPAMLEAAGIEFALTSDGLKKKSSFLDQVRKAIEYGLSEKTALKALTHNPATFCKATDMVGSLNNGTTASFLITDQNIFDKKAKILEVWVHGKRHAMKSLKEEDISGNYNLKIEQQAYNLVVTGKESPELKIVNADSSEIKVKGSVQYGVKTISLSFNPEKESGKYRLQGVFTDNGFSGKGQDANGNWVSWTAEKTSNTPTLNKEEKKDSSSNEKPEIGKVIYPFVAFGREKLPEATTVLFKNATVWTNEKDGILENADVLVSNGKIQKVGKGLDAPAGATTVDASGKHLTSGIIDEHTHIGVSRGVNEGTQASSAEVRIGDVVNPEDINIYRQLSGGVTAAQQLHGSANPIGGQSSLIKFRWGKTAEELKIKGADGYIKFALGENVKQSNWGDNQTIRFPQTRMGVEQVFVDHFTRAKEYGALKASGKPYRKDLELEALLEIINKERFITCHSYRQSEINMLMKVAEQFGFTVNTFTHILEGYKVADKMAEHGAGGSTFADWWAYKFEVWEAIPYNGALMHEQGVVVAYNSDDAEMARRLNQEAAKAVKYGNVSEEDAWKFVTLNPAKLLHLDDRMGSIKAGKDADLVLWSDNPLSIEAKGLQTYVDGVKYFDREEDKELRQAMASEKNRIIQKMLDTKKKGGKTRPVDGKRQELYHCDSIEGEEHQH